MDTTSQISNRNVKQGAYWAWFVYFVQIPFVIWYAQGKVPIHPIVFMLPLIGLLNFKVERRGREGIGLRLAHLGRSLSLAIFYAGFSLIGLIIAMRVEGLSISATQLPPVSEVARLLLISFLISVFIIALWEEFVNRGYIQTRLQAAWGFLGVIVTSLLFATLHIPSSLIDYNNDLLKVLFRFVEVGLAGFVLGYVYWKTRSVLTCIAIHGLNNFITTGVIPLFSGIIIQEVLLHQTTFHLLWLTMQIGLTLLLCHFFFRSQEIMDQVHDGFPSKG